MMEWNYRVIKTVVDDEPVFKVVEVFYDEQGKIVGWTDCSDTILVWDNYEDLKGTAEYVLEAFKKPVLIHVQGDQLILDE